MKLEVGDARVASPSQGVLARLLISIVRVYRAVLSPLLGPSCRFEPTCSAYGLACLTRFGAGKGSWLLVRRILRCHPFHPGGYDPPPDRTPLCTSDTASRDSGEGPGHAVPACHRPATSLATPSGDAALPSRASANVARTPNPTIAAKASATLLESRPNKD